MPQYNLLICIVFKIWREDSSVYKSDTGKRGFTTKLDNQIISLGILHTWEIVKGFDNLRANDLKQKNNILEGLVSVWKTT